MERFSSKKDASFVALISVIIVVIVALAVLSFVMEDYFVTALLVLTIGLFIWLLVATYYAFGPDELVVRSGPLRWKIPYQSIERVRRLRSSMSGPALSMDRLEVTHSKGNLLISPKDEQQFLRLLLSKNPQIRNESEVKK